MLRLLSVLLPLFVITTPGLLLAQFAPDAATQFSSLEADVAPVLTQELTLFEGEEDFSSLLMTFDIGSFDFESIEVDDVIGSMTLTVEKEPRVVFGSIERGQVTCDIIAVIVGDDELEAEVVATEVEDVALDLIEEAGGSDPTDEIVFVVYANATDVTLELEDTTAIPSATALTSDIEIEWDIESGYQHAPVGGTLTVTELFTSVMDAETEAEETFEIVGGTTFMRGDINGNGSVSALTDSLALLNWAFTSGATPPCMDAADVDNSGSVLALVDALALLNWAFSDGAVPPDPGPEDCGEDPEGDTDDVACEESTC